MDPITERFVEYYRARFREHGATPAGLDWGPHQSDLDLRYRNMLAVISEEDRGAASVSLLDVGCGFGGLLAYAKAHGVPLRYTGVDIVAESIDYARSAHPDADFTCGDIFALDFPGRFDYVACNGILTARFGATIREMDAYAKQLLRRMFALSAGGAVANFMTTKVNYMEDKLYYANPIETIAFCLSELTTKIRLDHAYKLYEYTVYLYRAGALEHSGS